MVTFGSSTYLWLYAPERLMIALSPTVRRLALIGSVLALLSAIVWLALEAASMADDWSAALDPGAIGAVLTDTAFGHAWAAHLALAAALAAVVVFGPRARWAATAVASAALLASLGLVGHAAMQTGAEGVLHRMNHAVHLLTAGAWVGGLFPFVMCVNRSRGHHLRSEAVTAMMRFSFYGHFVVATLVLTGAANIALTSERLPIPPDSPYRALLDAKIVIVAVMIVLAIVNRYALVPRLKTSVNALGEMRVLSLINVALGTVVVALVSVFALLDPA